MKLILLINKKVYAYISNFFIRDLNFLFFFYENNVDLNFLTLCSLQTGSNLE